MTKTSVCKQTIIWGFIIRVALIFFLSTYENIYDQGMVLTDIDYKVYSDSTLYDSPYDRHTYRYSPIISYLMRFNYTVHESIGKVFFAVFDVVAMIFLYAILSRGGNIPKKTA
jgi:phosphatidylinositol glycan class M